jgi:integrase
VKLTEARVRDMPPAASGEQRRITVDGCVGLVLRVSDTGRKTWWLRRQQDGRRISQQLGEWPAMSLVAAKAEAEGKRERPGVGPSMTDLWRRYASEHLPKRRASTAEKDLERWRVHVEPAIGTARVDAITRDDVAKLHASISKKAPGAANRVLSLLSKMFSLAERWGMRTGANPARGHDRNPERKVERYLTVDEYTRLVVALEVEADVVRDAVELVMHTGARIGEVLERTRADVDVERKRLRMGMTKTGPEWLTCSPTAWAVVKRRTTDPLFPIEYDKVRRRWQHVIKRARIEPTRWTDERGVKHEQALRLHDLRHGFASMAAGEGLSLPQIGGLLRHKSPATTQRYVHLVDATQREHAARVSAKIPTSKKTRKR